MRRRVLLGFCAACVAVLAAVSAPAQELPVQELAATYGLQLQWDPFRRVGVLADGESRLSFRPGLSWMVLDYGKRLPSGPVTERAGAVLFSAGARAVVDRIFGKSEAAETADTPRNRIAVILLDPGHGGKDPGAVRSYGTKDDVTVIREKDVVLKLSQMLHARLVGRYPDKTIAMTRYDDSFPELLDRVEQANGFTQSLEAGEAVIYVSVHANASLREAARGFETWFLPPDVKRDLVDPESVSDADEDILPILNSMREDQVTMESVLLGRSILAGLDDQVGDTTINRGLKAAAWYVVKNAKMPSVLVEVGFITNQEEADRLLDDEYLQKLATGIYNGITNFVDYFEQ
jgi:N-acetylmuramoyl-L-alanine amidase